MRFESGQTVLRRYLHRDGRLGRIDCGRVLSDDERGLLMWVHPGSGSAIRVTLDGVSTRKMPLERKLVAPTILAHRPWFGNGVLQFMPVGEAHSVWWFFSDDGDFRLWYVNLEKVVRRWAGGLDVVDQALDVTAYADRTWEWKDEDEFAERTDVPGFWTSAEAAEIRAEGEKVMARVEAREFPFDGWLCDFAPDPAWGPTPLPWWWDQPPEFPDAHRPPLS
ncbi:MAG: DUF402 domain-containing protein [Stackebrandtia sp.]